MKSDTVGRQMEILLVEDSITSARLTIGILKQSGVIHRLTWLTDGTEALEFLHRRDKFRHAPRPDLMLLDLGLPGLDGQTILSEVRGNSELQRLPVMILTASQSHEVMHTIQALEVQGYLTKPIDIDQFLSRLHELKQYWKDDMILPVTP